MTTTDTHRDWLYRFVDEHGLVHVEPKRVARRGALITQCGLAVDFGEPWDDDRTLIVTCVACAAGL